MTIFSQFATVCSVCSVCLTTECSISCLIIESFIEYLSPWIWKCSGIVIFILKLYQIFICKQTSHSRRVFFECPKEAISRKAVVPGSYCKRCGFNYSFQWILIKVLTAIAIGHLFGILPVTSGSWSFRLKSFKFYYALLAILSIFFLMLISLYEQSINKITSSKICEESLFISSAF